MGWMRRSLRRPSTSTIGGTASMQALDFQPVRPLQWPGKGSQMQFGAFLPTYSDDYQSSPLHVAINGAALAAEALGYDGVWANDQMINPAAARRGTLAGAHVIEPLVTLASLVHLVPKVTLGVAVLILPQRNAILVAKQAAALHLLSQHRLILGVGIGHRAEEFKILGADFGQRAAVTDE